MKYVIFGAELLGFFAWFYWGVSRVGAALNLQSGWAMYGLGAAGLVVIVALAQLAHVAFKAR